ncbi:MAG: ribosomal protein S18-alanine N-acetyltransferase [Candidatus Binatia bacterium]
MITDIKAKERLALRLCTESDLPAVLEIERGSFSTPWKEESFRNELNSPHSILWVAEWNGCVIGYICLWFIFDEGQIVNFAIHSQYRRRGIGNYLLDSALTEAKNRHIRILSLEVRSSNTAALTLYKNSGFHDISIRRRYYENGEDALVMVCELSAHLPCRS